jgi:hypothetical protein
MDLGTVQNRLNNADYLFIEDVIDDLQLIWDNCKTYNLPGSVIILFLFFSGSIIWRIN